MYNQVITQLQFNNYTQADWQADCSSCASSVHASSQPISENCEMCIAYSEKVVTYNYFDLIVLLLIPIILFKTIGFFIRKK